MNADFSERRVKMVDGQIRTTDVTNRAILEAMLVGAARGLRRCAGCSRSPISTKISRSAAAATERCALPDGAFALRQAAAAGRDRRRRSRCSMSAAAPAIRPPSCRGWADPWLRWRAIRRWRPRRGGLGRCRRRQGERGRGPLPKASCGRRAVRRDLRRRQRSRKCPASCSTQLAEGGRLVAVEGQGNSGVARVFLKNGGIVTGRRAFNAAIKPLPGFERIARF